MGTIVSEFTCIEFSLPVDYDKGYDKANEDYEQRLNKLKDMINEAEYSRCFNLTEGHNGNLYFTAAPCGSKERWPARRDYGNDLNDICRAIKSASGYFIIKHVTTSAG